MANTNIISLDLYVVNKGTAFIPPYFVLEIDEVAIVIKSRNSQRVLLNDNTLSVLLITYNGVDSNGANFAK